MPDITLCTNDTCPLKISCWRYNAPPNPYQQSYARFEPQTEDEIDCDYYIKMPKVLEGYK